MRNMITCMGECLIDFLPLPQQKVTTDFRMYAAGSILNVAVGIARLGQPAAFCCKIADDFFGRYLQTYINKEGIDTRFLSMVEGHSTLAFVTTEAGQPSFSFYGDAAADTLLTDNDIPEALFTDTSILHIGSISLLRGITPTTILHTFEKLKGKALLSLDPNIRPDLVKDEVGYRALLKRLIALTDVLKLSDVDLAWLVPSKSLEEAMQELLNQGPALLIITKGKEGAVALRNNANPVVVSGFSVDVIDTVGAGDTFCAGTLTKLSEFHVTSRSALVEMSDTDLQTTLRFATAAAALNCTKEGANPPLRADLEHFLIS